MDEMELEMMKAKLNTFCEELEEEEKAENTIKKYKRVCTDMIRRFEELGVADIRKSDMIHWKKQISSEYSPTSIRSFITIANKFVRYCETDDISMIKTYKSVLEVKQIRDQKNFTVNNVVSESDLERLTYWARKLGMEDMRLMIIVLSRTGVRFSELKFFTVERLANRTQISIYNKGKHRQITIPDDVKREINAFIKKNGIESGYVFRAPRDKERPIGLSTAWERFQRIAGHAKISLNKAHAHSFRHLFTKKLISEGNSIELVADILGHSSTETTRGYARLNDVEMKDVMNSVHYKKRRGRKKNEKEQI